MADPLIPLRLGLVQRAMPSYRVPFFDALARACAGGLGLFAGQARSDEYIESGALPGIARLTPARNLHFFRGPLYLCWQSGILDWLNAWQPDALVVEANPRYLSTSRAIGWMRARRRPVIGWGLGAPQFGVEPTSGSLISTLRSSYWRRFLGSFDALIAYSRRGAEQYRQAGFPAGRVFVAPNSAVPRPADPPPDRPEGYAGSRPTLLFVGRLQARKRIDLLLQACAALPEGSRPRLWVVGDGPARSDLENLAHSVYPQAQFFGSARGAELEPYYLAADLFVLPGTGGLAVQQAMSCALPVVVAEGDGTQSELVRPGNGWQVAPNRLDALVDCLAGALSDPGRLRRMGRESFRIVREEINLDTMVAAFAAAVRSVA